MTVRVLLVDAHELIRQGLRSAFEQTSDLTVVAEASCLDEAFAMERLHQPDVVIIDMPLVGAARAVHFVRNLRANRPATGVVALTMDAGDEHLFIALEAGASAFVRKWAPVLEVVAAVRSAGTAPDAFTATDLVDAMRRRGQSSHVLLTPRENGILQLLSEGLSVSEVSAQLFISASTTKTHMARLYDKLDANNRTQAVMQAVRLGLVKTHAVAS